MIQRILWTDHAQQRLRDRGLTAVEAEQVVREGHDSREVNKGDANWRVYGTRSDGSRFAVIYDHPVFGNRTVARIVSVWRLRD